MLPTTDTYYRYHPERKLKSYFWVGGIVSSIIFRVQEEKVACVEEYEDSLSFNNKLGLNIPKWEVELDLSNIELNFTGILYSPIFTNNHGGY